MSIPGPTPLYLAPLVEPINPALLAQYEAAHPRPKHRVSPLTVVIGSVIFMVFVVLFSAAVAFQPDTPDILRMIIFIGPIIFWPLLIAVIVLAGKKPRSLERPFRFTGFAAANGMEYYPTVSAPPLPGMIFDKGSLPKSDDIVRMHRPQPIDVANFSFVTHSDKSTQVHRWSYVLITLPTPLPHIVLDATSNNSVFGSNLPDSFDKTQRLSLEGDFDSYFTLYCPKGYERDALYLFTPDIMARFIDTAATLDVEIIDNHVYLYSTLELSSLDPNRWMWIVAVIDALVEKIDRWARWRDEQLAAELAQAAAYSAALEQAQQHEALLQAQMQGDAAHRAFQQAQAQTLAAPPLHPAQAPVAPAQLAGSTHPQPAHELPSYPGAQQPLVQHTAPPAFVRPPIGVAVPGQRLRKKFPLGVWIAIGFLSLPVLAPVFIVVVIFVITAVQVFTQ